MRSRAIALPIALGIALVAVWEGSIAWLRLPAVLLPRPGSVAHVIGQNYALLQEHAVHTIGEAVAAIVIAALAGVALALSLAASRLARAALMPNLVLLELIPKIALAPLFIVWLGNGTPSRLAFAFFLSFFPVLVAATIGLSSTDPALVRLCRAVGASRWQALVRVRLPYALPMVFSGIKIGTTMALIGVIVGEFITGNRGLGYLIMFAASNMETALMLGAMVLLCVLGTIAYAAVVLLERLVLARYGRPGVP